MELNDLAITQIREGLGQKKFSAVELTQAYLNKIEAENKNIFAYLAVAPEIALAQAKIADEKIAHEENIPPLCGVPFAIKDNIMVEGLKCTSASKMLENYLAPYDATVIKN